VAATTVRIPVTAATFTQTDTVNPVMLYAVSVRDSTGTARRLPATTPSPVPIAAGIRACPR
jgi:hypothetical protein